MEMNPMRKNGPAEDAAEHSNTSNVRSDDDYDEDAIEEPKRATLPNAKRASMLGRRDVKAKSRADSFSLTSS